VVQEAATALKAGDDYKGEDSQASAPERKDKKPKPQKGPEPTVFHKEIYEKATPLIQQALQTDPDADNSNLKSQLDALNALIQAQNRANNPNADTLEANRGTIQYNTYLAYSGMSRSYQSQLAEDPATFNGSEDEKKKKTVGWNLAKESLPKLGPTLDDLNKQKGYPAEWNWPRASFPQLFGNQSEQPSSTTNQTNFHNPPEPRNPSEHPSSTTNQTNFHSPPEPIAAQNPPGQPEAVVREPDKTREGHEIIGARRVGPKGYLFFTLNGEDWEKRNVGELRSSSDLGYDVADEFLRGKKQEEWDIANSQSTISREEDAPNYKHIIAIASNPIRTRKINGKPRYPAAYALTYFEKKIEDGVELYHRILDRTAFVKLLGDGATDSEFASFYIKRSETPPWEVEPLALTTGKARAIDAVSFGFQNLSISGGGTMGTAPVTTQGATATNLAAATILAPTQVAAINLAATPTAIPVAIPTATPETSAESKQLLLKGEVEGLKSQMEEMMALIRQLRPDPARVAVMA
jgi:hypothetical protein